MGAVALKVLLTGSSGFIGRHVTRALLDAGHVVLGYDRVDREGRSSARDILRPDWLRFALDAFPADAVIHLAARVGVRESLNQPADYVRTNVDGSLNVLDVCREYSIRRVVIASSSSVYGASGTHDEDTPLRPLSPYAASKVGMEALGQAYATCHDMDVLSLRLFTVYGEGVRPDLMVYRLFNAGLTGALVTIFDNGALRRDWTYVGDVARAFVLALDNGSSGAYNIGTEVATRLTDLIVIIEAITGGHVPTITVPTPPTEPVETCANFSRAYDLLGWTPEISLGNGLRRTWAWMNERVTA